LVSQLWQGPPCAKISSYSPLSKVRAKICGEESCESDENDLSCCRPDECVDNGKCYPMQSTIDVDGDGDLETCSSTGEGYAWLNPDSGRENCGLAKLRWFECGNADECEYGINDYSKKSGGLCCGDEKEEKTAKCGGVLCSKEDDLACCPENSCVFNGKCYQSGCSKVSLGDTQIAAYCQGDLSQWVDLDKDHCIECIGKGAWSGSRCCGDDLNEGRYPIKFIVNSKKQTDVPLFYGCSGDKDSCVYPNSEFPVEEGLYISDSNAQYLRGAYYCKNSQWYTLDFNPKSCRQAGFEYLKSNGICCGDNENEHFINGDDKTSACCLLKTDKVIGGKCISTNSCGNGALDKNEECESPDTQNNANCPQARAECSGARFGTRNTNGYCSNNCACEDSQFEYKCAKGQCGASCSSDNDCGDGKKCNPDSCSCESQKYCGDGVVGINHEGQKEECELPGTLNNPYCKYEPCKEKKSISSFLESNYTYALCTQRCRCSYEDVDYLCKKGSCGAECNDDGTGCAPNEVCNTEKCGCQPSLVCGNRVCEEGEEASCSLDCRQGDCPYRINLKTNKDRFVLNETILLEIGVYDREQNGIADARFEFDVIVNNAIVGTSTFVADSKGTFEIARKVTQYTASGLHKFIVKTRVPECSMVSDAESVRVDVKNPFQRVPPVNFSQAEFVLKDFIFTYDKIEEAKCGDNVVEFGEACEGKKICRRSLGCDYANKVYDIPD
ncbi:hypothetical protein HY501_02850, partial [Candidatus Woesearchaeota archaeon]|nr:hypothetical protein [Candidatus Woesearchaeota archaeon]